MGRKTKSAVGSTARKIKVEDLPKIGQQFVVAVEVGSYILRDNDLMALENGMPSTTLVPSMAVLYTYREADAGARLLRAAGYDTAHVCDLTGMPATIESIHDAQPYSVRYDNRTKYFVERRGGQPYHSLLLWDARAMTRDTAEAVAARLREMGFKDAEVFPARQKLRSEQNEILDVWGVDEEPVETE